MAWTSAAIQSFFLPLPDSTATSTINETFNVLNWPIYIMVPSFCITILKDDSMVGHHIGLNWMHPDRSSCRNLSVNGSNGLTDNLRFWPTILQDKNPVLSLLKCMDGSVFSLPKCMDGSLLAVLKCKVISVWTHLGRRTTYNFFLRQTFFLCNLIVDFFLCQ